MTLRIARTPLLFAALLAALPAVAPSDSGFSARAQAPALIPAVRAALADSGLADAERLVDQYRAERGVTTELMAAISWLGRGALAADDLQRATQHAIDAYDLAVATVDRVGTAAFTDPNVETALGAAIEVQGQVRAARGNRSDAVYFLTRELEKYGDTVLHMRIQKNIHLLSLAGLPAPPIDRSENLGTPVPSFDELEGQVVLLFFWAHWCSDCKAQGPIVERLLDKYRDDGLALVAPTQRYGYIVSGTTALPAAERRHIIEVRDIFYPFLVDAPVPLSTVNHENYGVSSTPTLALVDREGIVQVYHPGNMTEEELEKEIRKLL